MLRIIISWKRRRFGLWQRRYYGEGILNPDAVWPAEASILNKPEVVALIEIYEDGTQFKYEKVG